MLYEVITGEPVLIRDDPALDFNWGSASPGPNMPADHFSVRWTRAFEFTREGDYHCWADKAIHFPEANFWRKLPGLRRNNFV